MQFIDGQSREARGHDSDDDSTSPSSTSTPSPRRSPLRDITNTIHAERRGDTATRSRGSQRHGDHERPLRGRGSRGGRRPRDRGYRGFWWHFTSFDAQPPSFDPGAFVYAVYQQERAPDTGRLHYQGFFKLKTRSDLRRVKGLTSDTWHLEQQRGSVRQSIDYCTKDDTRVNGPYAWGSTQEREADLAAADARLQRGGRNTSELDRVAVHLRERGGIRHIATTYPGLFIRHYRGLFALRAQLITPRDPAVSPTVRVYQGPSGSGKSRSVYAEFDVDSIYTKDGSQWWDGYDAHPVILFDDWTGNLHKVPPTTLLTWTDRYPCRVEIKGSYSILSQAILIFTTMVPIERWYGGAQEWLEQIPAFQRRVTRWETFPRSPEDIRQYGDQHSGSAEREQGGSQVAESRQRVITEPDPYTEGTEIITHRWT